MKKVVRLSLEYEQQFLDKLIELEETSKDKNRDWYRYLQKDYTNFEEWYFVIHDNEIIAFSAVHKIDKYYRMLSRLWYDDKLRKYGLNTPLTEITPAMMIAEFQLEDFNKNLFCSMEYPSRRKHLEKVSKRLNFRFNRNFKLNSRMHLTYNNHEDFSCWQNTISEIDLDLPSITVEQWRLRFDTARKTPDRED